MGVRAGGAIVVRPRAKSSALWGAVGALAFFALAGGYDLLVAPLGVGFLARLGAALVVGAVVAATTYAVEHRLVRKGRT